MTSDIEVCETATIAWFKILERIIKFGVNTHPRGLSTKEILHNSIAFNMKYPVIGGKIVDTYRKLSYKFMAAEALWILSGDNSVDGIVPYCKKIAQFSDDGKTFYGAYGPRYNEQVYYIINSLCEDKMSRQATMTFWRKNPPKTKDVPCTVAMSFMIRNNKLNCHVYMRSSDAWLGVPYDFFNFTMIAHEVATLYNSRIKVRNPDNHDLVSMGNLYWTAASSHLYKNNIDGAEEIIYEYDMVENDSIINESRLLLSPTDISNCGKIQSYLYRAREGVMSINDAIGGFYEQA